MCAAGVVLRVHQASWVMLASCWQRLQPELTPAWPRSDTSHEVPQDPEGPQGVLRSRGGCIQQTQLQVHDVAAERC